MADWGTYAVLTALCSLLGDPHCDDDDTLVPEIAEQFKSDRYAFNCQARLYTQRFAGRGSAKASLDDVFDARISSEARAKHVESRALLVNAIKSSEARAKHVELRALLVKAIKSLLHQVEFVHILYMLCCGILLCHANYGFLYRRHDAREEGPLQRFLVSLAMGTSIVIWQFPEICAGTAVAAKFGPLISLYFFLGL
ncbi:MAG: hypothetical protein L6R35_006817, partial [Caloplaca aegaea]